jgi:hypothetical protein
MAMRSYRRFRAVEPRRIGRPGKSEDKLSGTFITQELQGYLKLFAPFWPYLQ